MSLWSVQHLFPTSCDRMKSVIDAVIRFMSPTPMRGAPLLALAGLAAGACQLARRRELPITAKPDAERRLEAARVSHVAVVGPAPVSDKLRPDEVGDRRRHPLHVANANAGRSVAGAGGAGVRVGA